MLVMSGSPSTSFSFRRHYYLQISILNITDYNNLISELSIIGSWFQNMSSSSLICLTFISFHTHLPSLHVQQLIQVQHKVNPICSQPPNTHDIKKNPVSSHEQKGGKHTIPIIEGSARGDLLPWKSGYICKSLVRKARFERDCSSAISAKIPPSQSYTFLWKNGLKHCHYQPAYIQIN